jgi:hypothetical protein
MAIYENDGTFVSGVPPITPTRLRVWQRDWDEDLPCPPGGAILHIRGDRDHQCYSEWFASLTEANAELERIALSEGLDVDVVRPPANSVYCGYRFAQPFEGWVEPR